MSPDAKILLTQIVDFYLASRDFNGLPFRDENESRNQAAVELVQAGLVQVMTSEDYPNIHIRPWPSKRSIERQVQSIQGEHAFRHAVCLYPTPAALRDHDFGSTYDDQPYREQLAQGRGTLKLAFFGFEVLEVYRNDPRFEFRFHDFGADTAVSNATYDDENEPDSDRILMKHIGFAYDLSHYDPANPNSALVRRVCAFLADLAKLTDVHQLRWKSHQVPGNASLKPHPRWWRQQMGHWPDGPGPFERFFYELKALNELNSRIFGEGLFKAADRPREFGWILRPTQTEYDAFIHQLDKLLSENLLHSALDSLDAARQDEQGATVGTIKRLDNALANMHVNEEARRAVLDVFREVRRARQAPAHTLRTNTADPTLTHKQATMIGRAADSLEALRHFWQSHPANEDWEESSYIDGDRRYRF